MRLALCAIGVSLLGACGGAAPSADRAALAAAAQKLLPADSRLADLYTHACRACHANAASGAPLTGDAAAWKPRRQRGPEALLDHTLEGLNGMPAGGQCARCSVADYQALIQFMADGDPR